MADQTSTAGEPRSVSSDSEASLFSQCLESAKHENAARLSDDEVRAILGFLHNFQGNGEEPKDLPHFVIVPTEMGDLKLTPPPRNFGVGLYVFLKPPSRNKRELADGAAVLPPHLQKRLVPREVWSSRKWSLSGPQYAGDTKQPDGVMKIQQRYCYPKVEDDNDSDDARGIGGAVWTMYGVDGAEDLTYRLLHVYNSTKRANNQTSSPSSAAGSETGSPTKKKRRPSGRVSKKKAATSAVPVPTTNAPPAVPSIQELYDSSRVVGRIPTPLSPTAVSWPWSDKKTIAVHNPTTATTSNVTTISMPPAVASHRRTWSDDDSFAQLLRSMDEWDGTSVHDVPLRHIWDDDLYWALESASQAPDQKQRASSTHGNHDEDTFFECDRVEKFGLPML